MNAVETPFEAFAKGLIPSQESVDPETLRKAKDWYRAFTGGHAVKMDERELVQIYIDLS